MEPPTLLGFVCGKKTGSLKKCSRLVTFERPTWTRGSGTFHNTALVSEQALAAAAEKCAAASTTDPSEFRVDSNPQLDLVVYGGRGGGRGVKARNHGWL